jgi:uncharacterized membrane protein YbaN (DUF454 family)
MPLQMKQIYVYFGFMSISAGVIGIFLPVMPTTPFLLLSIWFFHKTDTDFEKAILKNKWVGNHIRNYLQNRSMERSFKWKTILFVWLGLGISIYTQTNLFIIGILAFIGISVTVHICLLKNKEYRDFSGTFSDEIK